MNERRRKQKCQDQKRRQRQKRIRSGGSLTNLAQVVMAVLRVSIQNAILPNKFGGIQC